MPASAWPGSSSSPRSERISACTTSRRSQHDNFVGLDATQRNVTRPVLGVLQWVALVLAVVHGGARPGAPQPWSGATGAIFASTLVGWLILAGVVQGVPALIYQGASVNPNAQVAQTPSINDYLATSRYAWGLLSSDVEVRNFGTVAAPTFNDLAADPGTLRNVRIQDTSQLPDTFAQIDRSRSYQTYPTITVDRYPNSPAVGNGDTEVMLGPREISEGDIPNASFINTALNYTHGYGITAVSVNAVAAEGKPQVLVGPATHEPGLGRRPARRSTSTASPATRASTAASPTTQPVVTGTLQNEFDYPSGGGDATFHAGAEMQGIPVTNIFDKLAVSVDSFGSLDLFLNNSLTPTAGSWYTARSRTASPASPRSWPVDGDPYVVVDSSTGHLDYVADAYVQTNRFPESAVQNGSSYMRNAVKAVVDARTCAITLYAVDLNEPITAAWNAIYPGLLKPLAA